MVNSKRGLISYTVCEIDIMAYRGWKNHFCLLCCLFWL